MRRVSWHCQPMIRAARADELEFLSSLALRSKAFWGYSESFIAACRDELTVSAEELPNVFVLEEDGLVVGFYSLLELAAERGELSFLYVEPTAIKSGYGRALLEHAKRAAQQHGWRALEIQADPNAAAFYLALGARPIGERISGSIPGRMLPLLELSTER